MPLAALPLCVFDEYTVSMRETVWMFIMFMAYRLCAKRYVFTSIRYMNMYLKKKKKKMCCVVFRSKKMYMSFFYLLQQKKFKYLYTHRK